MGAEPEVHAMAEREVSALAAREVEAIRIGEALGVALPAASTNSIGSSGWMVTSATVTGVVAMPTHGLARLPASRRILVSYHEVIDHEPARVLTGVVATL